MARYLNFNADNCKNCYKCLRDCPVKAITVIDQRARIDETLCILCGHCANVCRFNAKEAVSGVEKVKRLLSDSKKRVTASVAPAFAASFKLSGFGGFRDALLKLGFADAEETARGAKAVTAEYKRLLESGKYRNLIASACPSVVKLIQIYFPEAIKYLAPAASPMVAHARQLKAERPDDAVVFIGPCIAKKREADECGIIEAALTFEELDAMLKEAGVQVEDRQCEEVNNRAKYYPINRGIIKSFDGFSEGYEYISVDGVRRGLEVLKCVDELSGMFIEMHACEFSCINGPCALNKDNGGFIKATERIRSYAKDKPGRPECGENGAKLSENYGALPDHRKKPSEEEIKKILSATGKHSPEDELNCGACGYDTCRDKAIAVYNEMAQLEMCVPYMRERAEGLSYDIIQSSPNGIIAVDGDFRISEINGAAEKLLGIPKGGGKGELLEKFTNPTDFYLARFEGKTPERKKVYFDKSDSWAEMTLLPMGGNNQLLCTLKDITSDIAYTEKLRQIKEDTVSAADEVIEKQMRVAQEIASLLGETTAETKVALIKLKQTLSKEEDKRGNDA